MFALAGSALVPWLFPATMAPLVAWARVYPMPAAAGLASAAVMICWQARPTIQLQFSSGWLAALPISSRQLRGWEAIHTIRPLTLLIPCLFVALIHDVVQLMLMLLALLAGGGLGFALAGHAVSPADTAVTAGTTRSSGLRLPITGRGRDAIARIPLVWTAARLSGRGMAPWLTVTLVLIPGGIGGGPSLLLIAVTVLTLAMTWLAVGTWRHFFLLADWLVATPLTPVAFARLTLVRSSLWFVALLFMLLTVLFFLQMPIEGLVFVFACATSGSAACFSTAFRHRFNYNGAANDAASSAQRSATLIVVGMCLAVLFVNVLWLMAIALVIVVRELREVKR